MTNLRIEGGTIADVAPPAAAAAQRAGRDIATGRFAASTGASS